MKKTLLLPATMIAILIMCGVKPQLEDCLEDVERVLKENTLTIVYSQEIENQDIDNFSCTLHGTVNTCPFERASYEIQDGRMGFEIVLRDSVIGTSGWYINIYLSQGGICLGINLDEFVSLSTIIGITPTPSATPSVPMVTNILDMASRNLTSTTSPSPTIVSVTVTIAVAVIAVVIAFVGLYCCRSKIKCKRHLTLGVVTQIPGEPGVTQETDGSVIPEQRNGSSLPKSSVTRKVEVIQYEAPHTPEPTKSFLNAGLDDIHNGGHHEDQTIVEGSYSIQCSDKYTIDNAGK